MRKKLYVNCRKICGKGLYFQSNPQKTRKTGHERGISIDKKGRKIYNEKVNKGMCRHICIIRKD
ncbi:MAG: hypothetical protein ACI4Q6_08880 [Huintestinicola sp.]